MDATSTEVLIPGAAETVGVPEARDSREKVLDAFNSAFGAFENYPADKLTPEQQSARDLIRSVKERTLDRDRVSYRNRFTGEDGKEYSQQEYMPVDELIIWLRERVKSGELSPEDEAKYREQEKVLHGNAQEYYRGRNKKENGRKMARVRQEAQRIAADPRLATGNDRDDWLKANDILLQRRELIIPPKKDTVEPPPPPPPPPPPEEIRREVAFVNRTLDVRKRAGEVAEELIRKEMRRGSILNPLNWGRKIGLRVMEEYWRQKLTQQVYTSMLANNNSYLNLDMARSQIGFADVFRRQVGNLTIKTQEGLGEEREAGLASAEKIKLTGNELVGQRVVEAQGVLKDMILNQIIRPAVEGGITDYAEIQQKLREFVQNNQNDPQVQAVFGRDATQYGRLAEYFASDILETAEVIRQDIAAHKYAIEQLDKVVTVKLANTSWAAETQAQFNMVDRAVAWAERHRLTGVLINPATIGAVFSIGAYGLMRAAGIGGRAAQIAVPGAGLLPGALFAAARRYHDLKIDMASHRAERAYNMQIGQGSPRREALEKFVYNTASVDDLINGGGVELVGGQNRESMDYLSRQDLSQEPNRQALIRRITEVNKRLDFSAANKVDLITFVGRGQVEQGRLALVRAVAQARVALRSAGVAEDVIRADETRFAGEWEGRFTQNKEQQDKGFDKYKVGELLKAGAFGAVAGLAGGFVSHEVLAGIGGFFEAPKPPVTPPSVPDINTIKSMFPGINAAVDPNGHINVTGAIPPDAQAEMQRLGFTVNQGPDIPGVSHTDVEHQSILGPDGKWTHATNIDHRELFRADQLKFHDFKDGNALILDMSKIDGMWTTHNGVAGVFVTTPDAPQDGFFIPDSADGVIDHKIRLDPDDVTHMIQTPNGPISNSELAKILINQDALSKLPDGDIATEVHSRQDVFNIGKGGKFGFIEAGWLQERPEGNVLQVYSTIRGDGPTLAEIEVPKIITEPPTPTYEIIPPPVPEIVPETEETPFIIPIPFAPRHPLEPLEIPRILVPGSAYGGKPREEVLKTLENNRSRSLKENPHAVLNPYQEANMYFDRQNPDYVKELEELAGQIKEQPSDRIRAVVCIPVAGHQEGGNIYNTLTNYTYQDVPRDQFEILLFVNRPETDQNGNPVQPDNTLSEIERFKKDYPDMPIRVISKILPVNRAKIGTIRKILTDAALLRQMQRGEGIKDAIFISNDADSKGVAPTYISNFIKRFNENPQVEGMLGQLDWDPEAYVKYPLVHIGTRLFQYLNAIGRFRSGRMPSSGANFAFRSSIYAAVGGYVEGAQGGEDIALGWGIVEGRGNHNSITYAGARVSRLYTSARRAINVLKQGIVPLDQWRREFSAFDDEIRKLQLGQGDQVNYDNPEEAVKLKTGLEWVINQTLDIYESGERLGKDSPYYRQALGYLGISYNVQDGKVVITGMDPLIRGLKHYQKIGVLLRDIKSGKGGPSSRKDLNRLQQEFRMELDSKDIGFRQSLIREDESVTRRLAEFNQKEKVILPDIPDPRYTLEELRTSSNIQEEGKYVLCLDKPLGSGQMGEIVAGYNKETGEVFAFKRVKKTEQQFIASANNYPQGILDLEDIISDELTNPVLGVYQDKIEKDDEIIKVYPIASTDLDNYLQGSRSVNTEQALSLTINITGALRDLHKIGIVHLDLSPTNILLTKERLRLTDFNAGSVQSGLQNEYKRGFVGGFRWIIPPELFNENPVITESSDTYEACILLYRLLVGRYPYHPQRGRLSEEEKTKDLFEAHKSGQFDIPDTIPDKIKNILRKGINPDPTKRYQRASELLNDLLDVYSQQIQPARSEVPPPPAQSTPPTAPVNRPQRGTIRGEVGHFARGVNAAQRVAQIRVRPRGAPSTETLEAAVGVERSVISGVGFSEMQGRRREMEDAHTMIENNFGGKPNQAFFGIYDGHGGREVADFAATNLHQNFLRELGSGIEPKQAFKNVYYSTDQQIKETGFGEQTGSTVLTAFVQGNKLVVANAGDARAVLDRGGQAMRLSQDHKLTDPAARARIERAGGRVTQAENDVPRVEGVLAIARSLGDHQFKRFIPVEPFRREEELVSHDAHLILACDGVWDVISDQEAVDLIKNEPDSQKASEILKNEAYNRGSRDNISVMVIKLNVSTESPPPVGLPLQPDLSQEALQAQVPGVIEIPPGQQIRGGSREAVELMIKTGMFIPENLKQKYPDLFPPPRPVRPGVRERLGNFVQGLRPRNQPQNQQPTNEARLERVRRNRQAVIDAAIKKLADDRGITEEQARDELRRMRGS